MWAVASIAGPLLAGLLAEWHWSLIYWLNLPLGEVAIVVVDRPLRKLHAASRAHRLDMLGALLLIGATSLLLLVLNWGGTAYPWTAPQIVWTGAVSLVLWVAFAFRLTRASEPLVSLEVLSNPIVVAGCFAMFMVSAASVSLAVFLPVYAQGHFGLSPAGSGYSLLGFLLGTTVGAAISGRMTMRVVRVKRIAILGSAVSAAGFVVLGLIAGLDSIILFELVTVVAGVALGFCYPVLTVSVQNGTDQHHLGVATGMLTFLRSLGSALGVAVLSAIALGYGIPLGAETGATKVGPVSDAFPFTVLFVAIGAMMATAAVLVAVMPHKQLRGRAAPAPAVE
jgi:MFS family permease